MWIRRMVSLVAFAVGLVPALTLSTDVLACACCGRFDEWMRTTGIPSELEHEQIVGLKFSRGLLLTEGVEEQDPLFLNGPVSAEGNTPQPGVWEFTFGSGETESPSVLRFVPEGPWEFFQTYPGPRPEKLESEVLLYKEVMVPGVMQITGSLAVSLGHDSLPAHLIFKGQGNGCFSGRDYSWWMLRFGLLRPDGAIIFVASGKIAGGKK